MYKIIKNTNFTALAVLFVLVVALTFTIGMVATSTSKIYAIEGENDEKNFTGQETISNLSSIIKNNSPSSSEPVMTVLTHGLGESAYAWSGSDGRFGYEKNSLIEQLAGNREENNTIVFLASVRERTSSTTCNFFLKELKKDPKNDSYIATNKNTTLNNHTKLSIGDAAKHIIIVFEGSQDENSLQGNNHAYSELRHIINKVLYDLVFWGAQNPRINLIGHGRGGILNLMYAAEYKYNVASMYSIGTPYAGASSLDVIQTALNSIDSSSDIINNYINSDGVNDFLTFSSQNLANWNMIKGFVDLHALGSAMRVDFFKDISSLVPEILGVFNQINTVNSTQELINIAKQNQNILGMLGKELNHTINLLDMAEQINEASSVVDAFAIMAKYKNDLNNYYVESLDAITHSIFHNLTDFIPNSITELAKKTAIMAAFAFNGYQESEMLMGDILFMFNQLMIAFEDMVYDEVSEMFTDITYELYYGYEQGNENNKNIVKIVSTEFFKKLLKMMDNGFDINFQYKDELNNVVSFGIEDIFRAEGINFSKLKGLIKSHIPAIGEFLAYDIINSFNNVLESLDNAAYIPGSLTILTAIVDYLYNSDKISFLSDANLANSDSNFTISQIGSKLINMLHTEIVRKNFLGNTSFLQKIQIWNDDFIWLNDGFVNSSSQLAENFDGVKSKLFLDESSNVNIYKPSLSLLPLPFSHNLQTRNQEILNYIVENIEGNLGNAIFTDVYRILNEGSAELVRLGRATKTQSSIVIPGSYDGREIVSISNNAFATSVGSNITSITLPDSIKTIGYRAFAGNDSLLTINLPTSLEIIGREAFVGCSELQNVTIPSSTYNLGENIFFGCTNLNITVDSGNLEFKAQNNILYNNDWSRIIFAGNVDATIVLLNSVTSIDNFAFYKSHVQSINLANVLTIGDSAFKESNLTTICGGNNLLSVGMQAFESTPWINSIHTNGMAVVGNTLIKYKGDLSNITAELFPLGVTSIGSGAFYESDINSIKLPSVITRIGEYAFSFCISLTEIVFSEFVNYVGGYSFRGCTSLYTVKFYGLAPPAIGIKAFDGNDEERIISVPSNSENEYKSYQTLAKYSSRVETLSITINYVSCGEQLSSSNVLYYGILTDMPIPERSGYTFGGWYVSDDPNETVGYQNGNICLLEDGANLYARWTPITYTISYTENGGSNENNPASYTIETETITLLNPTRAGYTFGGWFDNSEYSNSSVTIVQVGSTGNKEYFAKWIANCYTLTYDTNGGEALNPTNKTVEYAAAVGTLPLPERMGYTFISWMDSSGNVYDANVLYNVPDNLTLIAQWQLITYTILYTLNGGFNTNNPTSYTIETATIIFLNPTRSGYSFDGWFDNSSFTGSLIVSLTKGSTIGNKTYFAKWTANIYTITLDKNATEAVLDEASTDVAYASSFTFSVPTRTGYEFEGWYTSASGGVCYAQDTGIGTKNWDIAANTTLYAKWRIKIYTIQLSNGNVSRYFGASGISETPQTLTYGQAFNLNP
ncbi:MAG: InlB B-repeat-containing protein [Christensenellaceae bacterium]|nr:InlB B-repeat-containing protein [Christensenellaceae bacterium]